MSLTFLSVLVVGGLSGALGGALIAGLRLLDQSRALKRLRTSSEENTSAIEAHEEILLRIDARDRMRKVRAAGTDPETSRKQIATIDGLPDPYTHPDEWRKAMTARLATNGKR